MSNSHVLPPLLTSAMSSSCAVPSRAASTLHRSLSVSGSVRRLHPPAGRLTSPHWLRTASSSSPLPWSFFCSSARPSGLSSSSLSASSVTSVSVRRLLHSSSLSSPLLFPALGHIGGGGGGNGGGSSPSSRPWVDPSAVPVGENLKKYCLDLTELAREGKLDPVIGREEEMRRTIEILSRRSKNNPVLLGEPGVGSLQQRHNSTQHASHLTLTAQPHSTLTHPDDIATHSIAVCLCVLCAVLWLDWWWTGWRVLCCVARCHVSLVCCRLQQDCHSRGSDTQTAAHTYK